MASYRTKTLRSEETSKVKKEDEYSDFSLTSDDLRELSQPISPQVTRVAMRDSISHKRAGSEIENPDSRLMKRRETVPDELSVKSAEWDGTYEVPATSIRQAKSKSYDNLDKSDTMRRNKRQQSLQELKFISGKRKADMNDISEISFESLDEFSFTGNWKMSESQIRNPSTQASKG